MGSNAITFKNNESLGSWKKTDKAEEKEKIRNDVNNAPIINNQKAVPAAISESSLFQIKAELRPNVLKILKKPAATVAMLNKPKSSGTSIAAAYNIATMRIACVVYVANASQKDALSPWAVSVVEPIILLKV